MGQHFKRMRTAESRMNEYMHERKKALDAFTVKYSETIDPAAHLWERCASVLSRRDIVRKLSDPWIKRSWQTAPIAFISFPDTLA